MHLATVPGLAFTAEYVSGQLPREPNPLALNENLADFLWQTSMELTGAPDVPDSLRSQASQAEVQRDHLMKAHRARVERVVAAAEQGKAAAAINAAKVRASGRTTM